MKLEAGNQDRQTAVNKSIILLVVPHRSRFSPRYCIRNPNLVEEVAEKIIINLLGK